MKLTTRTGRGIAVTVTAVAVTAVAVTVASVAMLWPLSALAAPATPSGARAAAPGCETAGLVEWLNTSSSAATGSVSYQLEFTNLSGQRCTLNGFPFVSGANLEGEQLGRRASFDHSHAPHAVTLGAGKTATALLRVEKVSDFSPSACHPVTAAGLQVFPPNQTRPKMIPFAFSACSHKGPVYLTVGPVTQ